MTGTVMGHAAGGSMATMQMGGGMPTGGAGVGSGSASTMSMGLPAWLGVLWALLFAALLIWHARHAIRATTCGRQLWHVGHVAMAATMVVMYLPLTATTAAVAGLGWPLPVGVAAALLAIGLVSQRDLSRHLRAGLWLLTAVDLAAMGAMWAPGATTALTGCLLAATMCTAMVTMARLLPAPVKISRAL